MSDENIMNVIESKSRMSELMKDSISSSGIDKKIIAVLTENEASIVAFSNESIACAEHGNLHSANTSHSVIIPLALNRLIFNNK